MGFFTVRAFLDERVFTVNCTDINNIFIIREYYHFNKPFDDNYSNAPLYTFNNYWLVNQVISWHYALTVWDFYLISGNEKQMPYFTFNTFDEVQWLKMLDQFEDYFVMKTTQGFKFGLINLKELHVSALPDAESQQLSTIALSLKSRNQFLNNLTIDVLFLPFNDQRLVLQKYITTQHTYAGYLQEISVDSLISGTNYNLDFKKEGPADLVVGFQTYSQNQTFVDFKTRFSINCSKSLLFLNTVDKNIKNGMFNFFCIKHQSRQIHHYAYNFEQKYAHTYEINFMRPINVQFFQLQYMVVMLYRREDTTVGNELIFYDSTPSNPILIYMGSFVLETTLRDENFMYLSPWGTQTFLILEDEKSLILSVLQPIPCCSLHQQWSTTYRFKQKLKQVLFVTESTVYITFQEQCVIQIYDLEIYLEGMKMFLKNTITLCFDKMHYNKLKNRLVLMQNPDSIAVYDLRSQTNPIKTCNLPLFYEGLSFLLIQQNIIAESLEDGFFILLKNAQNETIISYYRLGIPVHNTLSSAQKLLNPQTKEPLNAQVLENSNQVQFICYLSQTGYPQFHFTLFNQDQIFTVSLRSTQSIFITFDQISDERNFTIFVNPALDPLTQQPRSYYGTQNLVINGTMRDLGLIVKQVQKVDVNVENGKVFKICASQIFQGIDLIYSIACDLPGICGNTTAYPIYHEQPFKVKTTILSELMRTRDIRDFFLWKDWIVIADAYNLISGLSVTDQSTQTIFYDFSSIGIDKVDSFFAFEEDFRTTQNEMFWALSGYNVTEQQTNLYVFRVQLIQKARQYQLNLTQVFKEELNSRILEMKYSPKWMRLFMTETPQPNQSTYLNIYKMYYDQQLHHGGLKKMGRIGANQTQVSPFFIQSFSIHGQLPIIFLGINHHGVVVLHVISFNIVFVVDLKKYYIDNYYINPGDLIQIAAIQLLSNHLIILQVNYYGKLQVYFTYNWNFVQNNENFVVFIDDYNAQYISAPWQTYNIDESVDNWLTMHFGTYFLDVNHDNDDYPKVLANKYHTAWLGYQELVSEWTLNIFNYFNRAYSKLFLRIPIAVNQDCTKLAEIESVSSYPLNSTYLAFCFDSQKNVYMHRVVIQFADMINVDLNKADSKESLPTEFQIKLTAKSSVTDTQETATLHVKIGPQDPTWLVAVTGFICVIVVTAVFIGIHFGVSKVFKHREQMREAKAEEIIQMVYYNQKTKNMEFKKVDWPEKLKKLKDQEGIEMGSFRKDQN